MFDKFQLQFFNLDPRSNYQFLNELPIRDSDQQIFLRESVASMEDMVRHANIKYFSLFFATLSQF